jgi:hypothetical protein
MEERPNLPDQGVLGTNLCSRLIDEMFRKSLHQIRRYTLLSCVLCYPTLSPGTPSNTCRTYLPIMGIGCEAIRVQRRDGSSTTTTSSGTLGLLCILILLCCARCAIIVIRTPLACIIVAPLGCNLILLPIDGCGLCCHCFRSGGSLKRCCIIQKVDFFKEMQKFG